MKKKTLLFALIPIAACIVGGLYFSGCSVFGKRSTPEPDYSVVQNATKHIEIRTYEPMVIAKTQVQASTYDEASGKAFRRLADYIFGSNIKDEKIGMTAPVFQEGKASGEGEKIGMTAPVFQNESKDGVWTMSFVMPDRYTMETIPKPKDADITLETVPAKTYAVIRFNGRLNPENIDANTKKLQSFLSNTKAWEAVSEPRSAGYDPPFTLPSMRRNEILIEVQPVSKDS